MKLSPRCRHPRGRRFGQRFENGRPARQVRRTLRSALRPSESEGRRRRWPSPFSDLPAHDKSSGPSHSVGDQKCRSDDQASSRVMAALKGQCAAAGGAIAAIGLSISASYRSGAGSGRSKPILGRRARSSYGSTRSMACGERNRRDAELHRKGLFFFFFFFFFFVFFFFFFCSACVGRTGPEIAEQLR